MTYAVATETLAADYDSGMDFDAIAVRRHISAACVRTRFKREGIPIRPKSSGRRCDAMPLGSAVRRASLDARVRLCSAVAMQFATAPPPAAIMQRLADVIREARA